MTTTFTIIAGICGLFAFTLHREEYVDASRIFALFSVIAFLFALYFNLNSRKKDSNTEERKILFSNALETISARTRLTIEIVSEFKETCKKYKYTMTSEQKEYIGNLLSALGDVRIIDEELKGIEKHNSKREELITSRRELLNKIEDSKSVIDEFLNEST
ncbi:MAG: hypothetical protein OQL06_09745 [Gammaproteobacteria bacterium]|nr:hypothetical protein [Gammaproteobacteria bacterium]